MSRLKYFVVGALCIALAAGPAIAAQVTANLGAQANIQPSCTITGVTNLNFGTYDTTSGTPNDTGAGDFTFRCTKNTSYDLYIAGSRAMTNGTEGLNFELYQDAGRSSAWPGGSPGVTGTRPNNSPVSVNVYGRIPALQDVGIGAFSNTVSVTVSY